MNVKTYWDQIMMHATKLLVVSAYIKNLSMAFNALYCKIRHGILTDLVTYLKGLMLVTYTSQLLQIQ